MSDKSAIGWTQATWSPTLGCEKVTSGCDSCYAIRTVHRMAGHPNPKIATAAQGLTHRTADGQLDWTGRVNLLPGRLSLPLTWRKPRLIFVNSQSDLFHKDIPDEFIARVWAVMAASPQHTYQCLTKRHGRMRSLLNNQSFQHLVAKSFDALQVNQDHDSVERWAPVPEFNNYEASSHGRIRGQSGLLSPQLNQTTGRLAVTLWKSGKPKTMTVHRLVLMAHIPQRELSDEVRHRNGNKLDNRLANLQWGTRSQNQLEKIRHGAPRGGTTKLTIDQVQEIRKARSSRPRPTQQKLADLFKVSRSLISMIQSGHAWGEPDLPWPLPNVHLGVSVEDQQRAELRIPALLDTPAAVRFISAEPLLGSIDLGPAALLPYEREQGGYWQYGPDTPIIGTGWVPAPPSQIDWVLIGGESGPGYRPMDLDAARSLVEQCQAAGVAVFVKQDSGPRPGQQGRLSDELWALKQYPAVQRAGAP